MNYESARKQLDPFVEDSIQRNIIDINCLVAMTNLLLIDFLESKYTKPPSE